MADKKLSELTELAATPAVDDEVYIRDVSEAAANESKRITVANLVGAGVSARAYQANAQTLKDATWLAVMLDTESYDTGGDMDITVRTGAADATEALKLHDADGGFEAGDVGATIWNTTDNTYALVTAFVDSGELTLDTDIMVNGEGYKLFRSWFVCPTDGDYLVIGCISFAELADTKIYSCGIYVNAALVTAVYAWTMGISTTAGCITADILNLSAADYIQLYGYQATGVVEAINPGSYATHLIVRKLP